MFGAESAQAERERLARQSQYAADLRRQMEDKENQRRQAFQSSATNHILQINNRSFASRNDSWAPSQYLKYQDTPSFNNQEKDSQDTSYTINNNNTHQQPTQHPSFGIKNIAEEQVQQRQPSNYDSASYQNNNNNNLQKIESQIQSLQNSVDRIISVEIPLRTKPSEEAITTLNSKLDGSINNNRETNQAIRDKLAELSFNYNQVNQKYLDQNEKLRSSVSELRTEVSRGNESTNARIAAVESRLETIESSIRSISNKQLQIERALNEQSSILSNSINDVQNNSNNSDRSIMNQLETLNKETISTFSQVNQSLQTATMNLNESITNLANDVRESFKIIRNEHDSDISSVKVQLDSATNEISESFSALQNEVVSTFNTFKGILKENITTVQDAIADESKARNESDQILAQNQKELSNGVSSQINILQENIEKVDNNVQPTVDRVCGNYFSQWKNELALYVNSSLKSIESLQSRLDESEKKSNDQQLLIDDNIKRLSQNEQRIDSSDQKDTQLQNRIDDFYKAFIEFRSKSENSDHKLLAEFTKIDQFNTLVSEVNKRFAVDENEITKLKALMNENAQSLKDSVEIFNANSVKFEKKFKKNKEKVLSITEKLNENEINKNEVDLMKASLIKLNDRFGTSTIDIPVCPRLDKLEEKMSKIKKKIPQNLGNRLGQIEISSANNQIINERLIRLETLLLNGNKSFYIHPQDVQHPVLVKRTRTRVRTSSKPPTPTTDLNPNPQQQPRPRSVEGKKFVNFDQYDSVSDDSLPITRPKKSKKSSLALCLDLIHVDVEPKDPKPGQFVLLIGEPKKSDRRGTHIFKAKKYDQFIFPDKSNFNEEEIRNLINASAINRSRKGKHGVSASPSTYQSQVNVSPLDPNQQSQFIAPSAIQPSISYQNIPYNPNQQQQIQPSLSYQNIPYNPNQNMTYGLNTAYNQPPIPQQPFNQSMGPQQPINDPNLPQQSVNQPTVLQQQPPFNQSMMPQQPVNDPNLQTVNQPTVPQQPVNDPNLQSVNQPTVPQQQPPFNQPMMPPQPVNDPNLPQQPIPNQPTGQQQNENQQPLSDLPNTNIVPTSLPQDQPTVPHRRYNSADRKSPKDD